MVSFKLGLGGGVALLGLGAIILFREQIGSFFKSISGGVETAENVSGISNILRENLLDSLSGIQTGLTGLSDQFSSFKFPDLSGVFSNILNNQQSILAGQTVSSGDDGTTVTIPGDTMIDPNTGVVTSETGPLLNLDDESKRLALIALEEGKERSRLANEQFDIDRGIFTTQPIIDFNVQTQFPGQVFRGGGPSFQGGSVSEIPIERLSLGQIIDRFNVTASQASDIRARALDDFGGFDFGTNTGSGIGNIPVIPNIGQTSGGFQGLTPQEIALRLTGGNISNF